VWSAPWSRRARTAAACGHWGSARRSGLTIASPAEPSLAATSRAIAARSWGTDEGRRARLPLRPPVLSRPTRAHRPEPPGRRGGVGAPRPHRERPLLAELLRARSRYAGGGRRNGASAGRPALPLARPPRPRRR